MSSDFFIFTQRSYLDHSHEVIEPILTIVLDAYLPATIIGYIISCYDI